jgi:hypothetical protein
MRRSSLSVLATASVIESMASSVHAETDEGPAYFMINCAHPGPARQRSKLSHADIA